MQLVRSGRKSQPSRCGAALTEFAVCLPLLTLVVFGGIETADMVFLKENVKSVSYEGGRAAAKFNSDNDEVYDRINALIDSRQIVGATVALDLPSGTSDVSEVARGEIIKITVSAPAESNTVGPLRMYQGQTIRSSTLMVRE